MGNRMALRENCGNGRRENCSGKREEIMNNSACLDRIGVCVYVCVGGCVKNVPFPFRRAPGQLNSYARDLVFADKDSAAHGCWSSSSTRLDFRFVGGFIDAGAKAQRISCWPAVSLSADPKIFAPRINEWEPSVKVRRGQG